MQPNLKQNSNCIEQKLKNHKLNKNYLIPSFALQI